MKKKTRIEMKPDIKVVVHMPENVRNIQGKINTIYDILTCSKKSESPADEICNQLGVAL